MSVRDQILNTAGQLFYERGIAGVSMDALRDRSGISLKSIYGEFRSKDGVVAAYLARRDDEWMSWLVNEIEQGSRDPRERLLGVFDALDAWFARPNFVGCAFINAYGEAAGSGWIADEAASHKVRLTALVAGLAAQIDGRRSPELAEELMVLIEGAIVRACLGHRSDAARTARRVASLIVDAPARQ